MSLAEDLDRGTLADVVFSPGELWSDEHPLETNLHLQQMIMLLKSLNWGGAIAAISISPAI